MSEKMKKPSGKNKKNSQKKNMPLHSGKPNKESPLLMTEEIPLVSANVPLASREIPLVSGYVPLVSSRPPITIPRYWGQLPSRHWGRTGLPAKRKKELRPKDIGLFKFLGKVITAPYQPVEMVKSFARGIHEIAEGEKDIKLNKKK